MSAGSPARVPNAHERGLRAYAAACALVTAAGVALAASRLALQPRPAGASWLVLYVLDRPRSVAA
jgi:hypothetical protein